jgi:hypothetical protein
VRGILGDGWETGGVQQIDGSSYVCPRSMGDERVAVSVLWPTNDAVDVAAGRGSVVAAGEINGWPLAEVGTLDHVTATLADHVTTLLARSRRRWRQPRG